MLPKLLFPAGSHGNFLSRSLSVASGVQQDFNFYADKKGAHANGNFNKIVDHVHSCEENDIWCNIEANVDDLHILMWHLFYAGGEFGLDLLKINSFKNLWDFKDKISFKGESSDSKPLGNIFKQAEVFQNDGLTGMREFFKLMHRPNNGLLMKHNEHAKNKDIQRIFKFGWFYNKEKFLLECKLCLKNLGYEYSVGLDKKWEDFIKNKKKILQSKELVQYAFICYINNIPLNISNFCVYQQGYLDNLIEKYLGYEIENWQYYPTNIADYKPTQAWAGKRYDI